MSAEQPRSARTETLSTDRKRMQPVRSASQHAARSMAPVCCAYCRLPLLIGSDPRERLNKSRIASAFRDDKLCRECAQDNVKSARSPSSRLVQSASINWSNMGDNIETWFEKAQTPDQRVVYNFLQEMNNKPTEKTSAKDLDAVLGNLKKYQTRFDSTRPRSKFTRLFESSSWRVLRQPLKSHPMSGLDQPAESLHVGSIFSSTDRKMRSTFLIHPDWV